MDSDRIVNFSNSKFAKIKCSCAVEDFYSIENLVSNDQQKLGRGFMAFRVVKPPVEIEFQLCCCIELVSIKIWPQIDSLKSTGFEILANSDMVGEYYKIGNHFNLQENGIQFINDSINIGHHNDDEDDDHSNSISCDKNFALVPFFSSMKNRMRRVKNIKCVIKQTARCTPVIQRIEIWGKISKFATDEQKQSIGKVIKQQIEQEERVKMEEIHTNDDNSSTTIIPGEIDENSAIPEEFLDTITFEIMALPMVLPSGKVIDNSTLLKHIEHEEKWGRVASDPFTLQPFTLSRKPVLNVHLKAQIDTFLLKNCTLPRTVGSITKRRREQIEERSSNGKMAKTKSTFERSSNSNETHNFHTNAAVEIPMPKLPLLSSSSSSSSSPTATVTTSSFPSTSEVKSRTLDEAIRGVLNVGKYTANAPKQNDSITGKCFQCPELVTNSLYKITICKHLICRSCLVEKNINICKCGQGFSNIDVNKYNHRTIL